MNSDSVTLRISELERNGNLHGKVNAVYVPCYLNGGDGVVDISYYDILPAIDITVFASYYEPWGYTPLESIAFGIPTITTDKSGFGQWILSTRENSVFKSGVRVIPRTDSNYHVATHEIAGEIIRYSNASADKRLSARKEAVATAALADWKYFIGSYFEAFKVASKRRDERLKKKTQKVEI